MIVVRQYGFAAGSGDLQNLVDGDEATFWRPLSTGFDAYTTQFLTSGGALNVGGSFAALEWDFGTAIRATSVRIKVETPLTLGPSILIGSLSPATSVSNTMQAGDVLLAQFDEVKINSSKVMEIPVTKASDVRFRYYRLLQRSTSPAAAPPSTLGPNAVQFDSGAGSFETPDYGSTFTIEIWSAGASGGVSANANDGGDTTAGIDSLVVLTAEGGHKPTAVAPNLGTGAGTGGVASGGNAVNTNGGDGGLPSPLSAVGGESGKGGDAPLGGVGGSPQTNPGVMIVSGNDGTIPGGGGSGRNVSTSIAGGTYFKFPGGGSGCYVKHVLHRGVDGPEPGDVWGYEIGVGGVSPIGDGSGANGRARFSWT